MMKFCALFVFAILPFNAGDFATFTVRSTVPRFEPYQSRTYANVRSAIECGVKCTVLGSKAVAFFYTNGVCHVNPLGKKSEKRVYQRVMSFGTAILNFGTANVKAGGKDDFEDEDDHPKLRLKHTSPLMSKRYESHKI